MTNQFAYHFGAGVGLAFIPSVAYLICAVLINAGRASRGKEAIFNPLKVAAFTFLVFLIIGVVIGQVPRSAFIGGLILVPFALSLLYYLWCAFRSH